MKEVIFRDLGLVEYEKAWRYQEELFSEVTSQKLKRRDDPSAPLPSNYLLFCEHPNVYTLGKSGSEKNLLASLPELKSSNAAFFKINRGGDITYHGPGQVVGYPILDLDQFFTDIHLYLRNIEEVVIRTLSGYGIKGERYPGYTGVWVDASDASRARKICAIGVRTSRWVTMHGWALNVNTDLSYFEKIIPCGIEDKSVTSLNKEVGTFVKPEEVKEHLMKNFEEVFGCSVHAPVK